MPGKTLLAAAGVLVALLIIPSGTSQAAGGQKPPQVYVDKGARPFECCIYREWVARTNVTPFDRPNGTQVVGHIRKGSKVLALTVEVHSVPRRVVAPSDHPDAGVKKGEVIYVLHYIGEGYWKVWHNGMLVQMQDFPGAGWKLKATWWVKLKSPSGIIGWMMERRNFAVEDACG
jgi:hypothetical protein